MGMFDDITVYYPLPGNVPGAIKFQTKDFECLLDKYTVSADGFLHRTSFDTDKTAPFDYTGEVYFYTGNVVASGPGTYTRNGEDAYWIEYKAIFVHGRLTEVELIEYRSDPAQSSEQSRKMFRTDFATREERNKWWDEERQKFEQWRADEKARRAGA